MPNWYWEKKDLRATPSQNAGLDFGTEARYRREGVRFIMEMGKALNLSHNTMATAAVYFHRFFMFHTFQDFPKFPVATCCLFLAGKAEETPKKCRDIIRTTRQLTNDRQFETFGVDPREEIMALERVLLQTIHFDLQVDHPYASIIQYAKTLKGDKSKLQKMVQMSWTFVNDSLCTTLCLQWEPEIVAIAVMYLAVKLSKFEVKDWSNRLPHHANWWDQFVVDLEASDLEEICHQVLDLYMQPTQPAREAAASPPPSVNPSIVQPTQVANSSGSGASTTQPISKSSSTVTQGSLKTTPPTSKARSPAAKSRPQTPPSKSRPHTPPPPIPLTTTALPGIPVAKPPLPPVTVPTVIPSMPVQVAYHPAYALPPPLGPTGPAPPPPPVAYSYPPNYPISGPPGAVHPHFQQPPYGFPPPPGQAYFPGSLPPPVPQAAAAFHRGPPAPPPPLPPNNHLGHQRY